MKEGKYLWIWIDHLIEMPPEKSEEKVFVSDFTIESRSVIPERAEKYMHHEKKYRASGYPGETVMASTECRTMTVGGMATHNGFLY